MSAVAILSPSTSPAPASRGGERVDAGAFGAALAETQGDGTSLSTLIQDGETAADERTPSEVQTPASDVIVVALPVPLTPPGLLPVPNDILLDEITEVSSFQADGTTVTPAPPTLTAAQPALPAPVEAPASQASTVQSQAQPSVVTVDAPVETVEEPAPLPARQTADAEADADIDTKAAVTTGAAAARPAVDSATLASIGLSPLPQGEVVRNRDVIDRALQRTTAVERSTNADTSATGGEAPEAPSEPPQAKAAPDARPTPTTQPPVADIAAAPLNALAEAGPEPVVQGGASTQTAETSPVTAQDLTLSTLARATIETTAQLAAQITRRLEGRYTRFELALTPEGLGRVDVSLDIDADGQLAARLAFDNPAAAIDLRGRADELRRQLEDAGFRIAHDGLDFAERDPSSGGGFDRRQGHDGGRAFAGAARLAAQADVAPPQWINLNLTPRGVDMKV